MSHNIWKITDKKIIQKVEPKCTKTKNCPYIFCSINNRNKKDKRKKAVGIINIYFVLAETEIAGLLYHTNSEAISKGRPTKLLYYQLRNKSMYKGKNYIFLKW